MGVFGSKRNASHGMKRSGLFQSRPSTAVYAIQYRQKYELKYIDCLTLTIFIYVFLWEVKSLSLRAVIAS